MSLPRARALAALAIAVALAVPAGALPARAQVHGTDLVGGRQVSTSATLTAAAPSINAPAGFLSTAGGRELWARMPDERRAMASITKIMTALVVLRRGDLSRVVTVTPEAVKVGESDAGIKAGDRLTIEQLLEAMLVKSANEAAMQLAISEGGSVQGFADLMNAEAARLGLEDSHFTNPHGLDQVGHYTSARDLAVLAAAAMSDPRFRAIVTKRTITLTGKNGKRTLKATDQLLGKLPGLEGIKTGFTNKAGYSFVGAAKRGADRALLGRSWAPGPNPPASSRRRDCWTGASSTTASSPWGSPARPPVRSRCATTWTGASRASWPRPPRSRSSTSPAPSHARGTFPAASRRR